MAEIDGEFPKCDATNAKKGHKKKKAKKLKRKLKKTKYKLKLQKKLNKECVKRCKAEAELKLAKLLLQNASIQGDLTESFPTLHKRK